MWKGRGSGVKVGQNGDGFRSILANVDGGEFGRRYVINGGRRVACGGVEVG